MGPRKAAEEFLKRSPSGAASYQAVLYGSLAATGKGHMTDAAIEDVFSATRLPLEIVWRPETFLPFHPNGMTLRTLDNCGAVMFEMTVYSVGGGAIVIEGDVEEEAKDIYPMDKLTEILDYCERTGKCYWEYVEECEGFRDNLKSRGLTFSYALAVSEENASGGVIVTAPTCGSCGVLPGVLYHIWNSRDLPETRVLRALATAGLIGNIVKENAGISARALDANIYAPLSDGVHRVSFDKLVTVMKETGHDLPSLYKETGAGGLAKDYSQM